ncbi:anaerobic ribonucleoside-triphosphate reductase [Acutalibacter muris]|uniref:anaerobic ribonucleoside-triphosphate reductase n=1 Tax=Acutalibacter muris TaxID=1796620 RepID=UPI0020CC1F04|nr:anaerobic ribonucleoside-triphosphate reductase [Acutalibacter muris]
MRYGQGERQPPAGNHLAGDRGKGQCAGSGSATHAGAVTMKYCKKAVGEGREFERIRRITGYLTGTLDGWNSAKRAEEKDRVKHPVNELWP